MTGESRMVGTNKEKAKIKEVSHRVLTHRPLDGQSQTRCSTPCRMYFKETYNQNPHSCQRLAYTGNRRKSKYTKTKSMKQKTPPDPNILFEMEKKIMATAGYGRTRQRR
ncbi:hypothetical protein AFLA70_53g003830 [Aspergillus flavus AF70]|nr:hypothetical protein AFLA70_53g003830 [Aspergillus flavus AF70]